MPIHKVIVAKYLPSNRQAPESAIVPISRSRHPHLMTHPHRRIPFFATRH